MTRVLLVILALTLPFAGAADTRTPLDQDPILESGLRTVAQGHIMRKNCDEISMRLLRAYRLMNSLKSRARDLGYSEEEMKTYFDDLDQKARVEALARAELESLGVDFSDTATFCVVARAQIEAGRGFGLYFKIR